MLSIIAGHIPVGRPTAALGNSQHPPSAAPGADGGADLPARVILDSGRTLAITESVGLFLLVSASLLGVSAKWGTTAGIYLALLAFTVGEFAR